MLLAFVVIWLILVWSHNASFMSLTNHELNYHELIAPPNDNGWAPGPTEANGFLMQWFYQRVWMRDNWEISALLQRLPMLGSALLTLAAMYALGLSIGGRAVALSGVFLLSIHTTFLNESAHCRFYVPNMAALVWATWALWKMRCSTRFYWDCLYAFLLVLCVGTMLLSPIALLSHLLIWIVSPRLSVKRAWVFLPALLGGGGAAP